jgi:hypothetical protein
MIYILWKTSEHYGQPTQEVFGAFTNKGLAEREFRKHKKSKSYEVVLSVVKNNTVFDFLE